ncbi:hypothetical protein GCM10010519_55970 [Streptomyces lactacystinicus]
MTHPLDGPVLPSAGHYELARVYAKYGTLPPADHAHLLALLAIADAITNLTPPAKPEPQPTTP